MSTPARPWVAAWLQQPDNIGSIAQDASGEVYTLMQDGKIFKIAAQ